MAEFLGVSTGTIGHWETEGSTPGFAELERIAEKLDEPVSYLLGFSEKFGGVASAALQDANRVEPWPYLSEECLQQVMQDLAKSKHPEADTVMDFLESVVREIRKRNKAATGGGGSKSSKVAQAVVDLAHLKTGKPKT